MSDEIAKDNDASPSDALAPGSKLLSGQYEILRYLSSGGFGITYLARDSLNRTVVIKECFPEAFCSRVNKTVRARTQNYADDFQSIVKLFIREAHALSRLQHSSVVGVHQVFEDNETAYMALDLVDGKDLLDIIETGAPKFSAQQVRKMTLELLDAIGHVHAQDLLHRDISPDNILVDKSNRAVLIDFGAAREEASRKSRVLSTVLVVKDGYSPQEFYVAGSQQLPCSDLYALAATLTHLITGEAPPNSQARLAALASNQPDLYQPLVGRFPDYDDSFLEAIDKTMSIVPADRLQSAEDWVLMIDHTKRVEIAREKAEKDKTIDQTVMHLVKSAQEQVAEFSEIKGVPAKAKPVAVEETPVVVTGRLAVPERIEEDLYENLSDDDLAIIDDAPTAVEEEPIRETPYLRVKSKALELERQKSKQSKTMTFVRPSRRMSRFATVPVVFCAYFFYAHTALKFDEVHTATIEPLRELGAEIGGWPQPIPAREEARNASW